MNTSVQNSKNSAWLSYFSLFTSLSTLLCCALPSVLVLLGLGATVASMLSALPWLVALSKHKPWTFGISGVLIAASFVNMYWIVPRITRDQICDATDPTACGQASRISKILLWTSAAIYSAGFFVAYALGPILTRLDR
jgi:mercuric ion transport protein